MWCRAFIHLLLFLFFPPAPTVKGPSFLIINGSFWDIVYVKDIGRLSSSRSKAPVYIGNTDCSKHRINILLGQEESDLYDTILHEAQHAMTCNRGLVHNELFNNLQIPSQKEDDYHSGIYWATPHWIEFMQDNPAFIEKLISLRPPLAPEDPPPYF